MLIPLLAPSDTGAPTGVSTIARALGIAAVKARHRGHDAGVALHPPRACALLCQALSVRWRADALPSIGVAAGAAHAGRRLHRRDHRGRAHAAAAHLPPHRRHGQRGRVCRAHAAGGAWHERAHADRRAVARARRVPGARAPRARRTRRPGLPYTGRRCAQASPRRPRRVDSSRHWYLAATAMRECQCC